MQYVRVTLSVEREDDQWVSRCRELDTVSCGHTKDEALRNIMEATELYLNTLEELGECAKVLAEKGVEVRRLEEGGRPAGPKPLDAAIYSSEISLEAACP